MAQHLALYGNVKMLRVYCLACRQWALVIQGEKACCDQPVVANPTKTKRITHPEARRLRPKKHDRERLLAQFEDGCAYCQQKFGTYVQYHETIKKLRLTWDHRVPWAYSQNNHGENFLPACQFCNGWKSSLMFRDLEEVQIYVQQKWKAEGVSPLSGVQREISAHPSVETVLLKEVPTPSMATRPSEDFQRGV